MKGWSTSLPSAWSLLQAALNSAQPLPEPLRPAPVPRHPESAAITWTTDTSTCPAWLTSSPTSFISGSKTAPTCREHLESIWTGSPHSTSPRKQPNKSSPKPSRLTSASPSFPHTDRRRHSSSITSRFQHPSSGYHRRPIDPPSTQQRTRLLSLKDASRHSVENKIISSKKPGGNKCSVCSPSGSCSISFCLPPLPRNLLTRRSKPVSRPNPASSTALTATATSPWSFTSPTWSPNAVPSPWNAFASS